ncbi:MAG TPA: TonB-dependent receptor, partial [Marinagarivorans sp.]
INIRGGATDGQGRDFRGQVLVLVDGRRAGTANISKLSKSDLARVEILRGPSSVIYGSQALGGVINLITRDGTNTQGGALNVETGSWDKQSADLYYGGGNATWKLFGSASYASQNDYESAGGKMKNTAWDRHGFSFGTVYSPSDSHRFELAGRAAGVYNAGFRGSSWDFDNYDDRYNRSLDLSYIGEFSKLSVSSHLYKVEDVEDFFWGSEASGIDLDNNRRELNILGLRNSLRANISAYTSVLIGLDVEQSKLENSRERRALDSHSWQVIAPFDNNQDETLYAVYGEASQSFVNERVTLRAGARHTRSAQTSVPTQGVADASENREQFHYSTYSAGVNYALTESWSLRTGVASGFRAPTATEYAADFELVLGGQKLGNPDLNPENSRQFELGAYFNGDQNVLDVALFSTRIEDRITSDVVGQTDSGSISRYVNSRDNAELTGIDLNHSFNLADNLNLNGLSLLSTLSGSYHFTMNDEGETDLNSDKLQRIYKYQFSASLDVSQSDVWSVSLQGVLRGPVWYQTEERLLIPEGEPDSNWVHQKEPFWVWNLRGSYQFARYRLYSGINNLFDKDEHPLFIALNREPYISDPTRSNGGRGNSLPGRNVYIGMRVELD